MLLRGQAGRKQAEELARKSSNQIWQNASIGVCGNYCPRRRPVVFSLFLRSMALLMSQVVPVLHR